jgi:hypothetical protein
MHADQILFSQNNPATSNQYFSLRTNQPPATSQQYFSLRTNQHQASATSQPNRLPSSISWPDLYYTLEGTAAYCIWSSERDATGGGSQTYLFLMQRT